jgi:hypothetical protein
MKRRSAIKSLTMAFGGLASMPAWASGWTPESVGKATNLSVSNEALLAEIVETIIPETTTPGAKTLNIHQFVMRMVNDCYDEAAQNSLKTGLAKTDELAQSAYGKPFVSCDTKQRTDVFLKLGSDSSTKRFADMVKGLTIRGYTNSEYYLNNVANYNMAPGFFHGCVPIKK